MTGNSLGDLFRITTFGESHGKLIGCIIDGCPSGIKINIKDMQGYINTRRPGINKFVTQRKELDKINIVSGILNNVTTGTPISIIVFNRDYKSKDYNNLINIFRPGHADYTYFKKFNIRDYRGGGRSSARTTVSIVIAGYIAKKLLKELFNINIFSYIYSIGKFNIQLKGNLIDFYNKNNYYLKKYLNYIRKSGNSVGASICININGIFPGIGEPIFDKLDVKLSQSLIGINAVKGIEIGNGINSSKSYGIDFNDEIYNKGFKKDNSGGILGGISNGQDINFKIHIKPTSSIIREQNTVTKNIHQKKIKVIGRHDPCVGLRACSILESITSIVLIDLILKHKARLFI